MKILCAIYLIRHPLGGHAWHHLQYLVGLQRLGHEVVCVEDFGWEDSCYDPSCDSTSRDPSFGIDFLRALLQPFGLDSSWCYFAEDGTTCGMSREELATFCRECDLFLSLSNMNWVDEFKLCRQRAVVDTDPVFTQIGAHGAADPRTDFHVRFTYGENVGRPGSSMPTGGVEWKPTRQPVVLDQWQATLGDASAPITSVINWAAYGDHRHNGLTYGQKDREFAAYFDLPARAGCKMELALADAPGEARELLTAGGWEIIDPLRVTRDTRTYQDYLRRSAGEWCVAKHGYVSTQCGWFSDRSAGYLASGRPVVLQDTGFSKFLPCGRGLLPFKDPDDAVRAIRTVRDDYPEHCRAARRIAQDYFDSDVVLSDLLRHI